MTPFLKVIRPFNLLMIIATQCIIKFAFFTHFNVETTLSTLGFIFLMLATVCIAAGGYIVNDIYDITADKINKPKTHTVGVSLARKKAQLYYYLFTLIGIGLGFVVSIIIEKPRYILYFIVIALGLYVYSRFLKTVPLVGNIVVSLMVGASLLIVGVFELLPQLNAGNTLNQMIAFNILRDISIFAFMINLLREIIKDIEDIQGDHVARYKTIPIILGVKRTAQITAVAGIVSLAIISLYSYTNLYTEKWAVATLVVGVIIPLGYVCAQLWESTTKKQFSRLSLFLKIIMFIGICAIPIISYSH